MSDPGRRAELLVTIAEHSPAVRRAECLKKALGATLAIPKDRDRPFLLNLLLPLLAELSDADHYAVWSGVLRTMGAGDRRRMLTDLMTLLPVFKQLSSRSTLLAFAEAVADTDDWFCEQH